MRSTSLALTAAILTVALALAPAWSTSVRAEDTITREQADTLIKEIRELRQAIDGLRGRRPQAERPPDEKVKVDVAGAQVLGRADAPLTLVEFTDLECPYCRAFHVGAFERLKREYIDTGKVRYVLRAEFPIGKQSGLATIALRCAAPDKYFSLYDKLMRQQASWVSQEVRPDPIFKVAQQVGMTRAQFDSCRENRGMINALNGIKERGRALGIIGTPNFFVQGKLVKSVMGIKEIREMVDPILAGRVAASDGIAKAR